jgi:hypothetical protein
LPDQFTCSICGTTHEGLTTDWAYKLPDVVFDLSRQERSAEARFNDDLCEWNDRFFIRAVLEMPFTEQAGEFGWGVWAEVEWPTFERYLELYDADGSEEPPATATLANNIRLYGQTLSLPVSVQFRDPETRPSIILPKADTSRLAQDQRNGVDTARYHEILKSISKD